MKLMPSKGFLCEGFTLVELLVVISIIAVLALAGFVAFSNVQKSARDSKRIQDINAAAKAFEVNNTSTGYIALQDSQFSTGKLPVDSMTSQRGCGDGSDPDHYKGDCWYCLKGGSANPTPAKGLCSGPDFWLYDNVTAMGQNNSKWMVCANLETGSIKYYCRGNTQ